MHDHLRCGARQCNIEQAQVLPRFFVVTTGDPLAPAAGALATDVEMTTTGVVVVAKGFRLRDPRGVPPERYVHNRELQSLARVHGHDLHDVRVAVETSGLIFMAPPL